MFDRFKNTQENFTASDKAEEEGMAGEETVCDYPGCCQSGLYPAPRNRTCLDKHYRFCLDHVRAYNKAWNYCHGLSNEQIEQQIREDVVCGRRTWPVGAWMAGVTRPTVRFFFGEEENAIPLRKGFSGAVPPSPEIRDALGTLSLPWPVTLDKVKLRYKELVKKLHPDRVGWSKDAEEKLKRINQAYATVQNGLRK